MLQSRIQQDIYPTRQPEREEVLTRQDPCVYGKRDDGSQYALTPDQFDSYEKHGHLKVPNLLKDEEITKLKSAFKELSLSPKLFGRPELVKEPESDEVRSIFNPHEFDERFNQLIKDPRLLDKVEQILGGPCYVYHSRINIKPPLSGKSFQWHSDFETWHAEDGLPRMRTVTAWIMLDENTELNGPLYVIPGSHKHFISCQGETPKENYKYSLRKQTAGTPSLETLQEMSQRYGIRPLTGKPGTLVFHECNLLHGSPDNISPYSRANFMVVFNSVENTPRRDRPYAAKDFRPHFLSSKNYEPLR